jgi:hypothetical protein
MPNQGLKVTPKSAPLDQPCTPYRAKAKPDMNQPTRNVRGVESVPTSRYPQRKTLPPEL